MAYLHCHNCGWSQDDFWAVGGYNPARYVKDWENSLLSKNFREKFETTQGNITLQEVIAREFERVAKTIREMEYRTMEEFNQLNPNRVCPKCGKKELDID